MLVNIYKNWLDDVQACTMSMEDFIKMEENEDDMGEIGILEMNDNIVRL
jgi:hypothetical protein